MKRDITAQFKVPQFGKRFAIMIIGIFCMGFFLSFLIKVNWGTDPCTFQNKNVAELLGMTLGNWQLLLNAAMLVLVIIFNYRLIGFGTICNMVLIGYTADFFTNLWTSAIPDKVFTSAEYLPLKTAIFALALLCFVVSAACYMNAGMGLSPYDAVPAIISSKLPKVPFFIIRICFDSFAVLVGLAACIIMKKDFRSSLLGSVIMAFALGPVIQTVGNFINKYVLKIQK